jgi:hypothetical protein
MVVTKAMMSRNCLLAKRLKEQNCFDAGGCS